MATLIIAAIIIVIILGIAIIMKRTQPEPEAEFAFDRQGPLFTAAERSFLGVLERALDGRYRVFGKVRLADLVKPVKGLSNSHRQTSQNKINRKHVDFVICSATDLSIIGVAELDDKSHEQAARIARDRFLDQALTTAGIPIIHFQVKSGYGVKEVRAALQQAFGIAEETTTCLAAEQAQAPLAPEAAGQSLQKPTHKEASATLCPKCSSAMVRRQAKQGRHAGTWFLACSSFPQCRQVLLIGEELS